MRSRVVQVDTRKITAARRGREILRLNLFDGAVVEVDIRRVRPTRTGHFISGRPRGREWGEVRLVVNGPVMVGTVQTPNGKFSIRSGGRGRHVIRQIDPLKESLECEAEQESTIAFQPSWQVLALAGAPLDGAGLPAVAEAKHMPTEDGSEIRMLVVYTPAAQAAEGGKAGMEALIDLAIRAINEVFEQGGISPRIVLAHSAMVDYVEPSGPGVHRHLITPDDGQMDEVHALRNQHAADLVYLFIRSNNSGGGSGSIPSAEDLGEERRSFAYGSTTYDLEYIFIHETGHMLGLKHDRHRSGPFAGNNAIYPYAYGYVNQKAFEPGAPQSSRWSTVMAKSTQCAAAGFSCPPIIRFSNPDQTYLGDPLGVPAESAVTVRRAPPMPGSRSTISHRG
ncbi:MAG: M12 family metallo-peptidase [Gammaproteobacteria bacterium]|nr:M12 family metallo-peptidase [Gammaproteobacteria bacterium]